MSVLIRPYRPEDRNAAMELSARLVIGVAPWRDPHAVRDAVTGWVRGSLDRGDDPDHAVLVAEDTALVAEGTAVVVGLVTVGTRRHFTGQVDAYVGELIVAEGQERRGIGRRLMRAAERWANQRGLRHLTLETGAANHSARDFYRRLGYLEEEVRLTREITG